MKKNDIYLICIILIAAVGLVIFMRIWQRTNDSDSARAVVTIDGQEYGTYPLNKNITEKITQENGEYNLLQIRDGYVEVLEASCRDKICVNHKHIHYQGETIVCLPNKVVVEIVGGEENDIDGATH
ncbi:MAG: NusG domain II-containing protein [Acetatifactor sp.]|nr:NusG domain II-containing protein [Acetatifactor sp.]